MAEDTIIAAVISSWKRMGVFDFILPFILVFGIVYGILERTQLFGKQVGKSVNSIIAFAIAMTTSLTGWFISFLTGYLPWVSTISIIIITALMLIAIFAGDFDKLIKDNKSLVKGGAVIVVASLAVVLFNLGSPILGALDFKAFLEGIGLSVSDVWGIVFFIGFIVALFAIGKEPSNGSGGS